MPNYREFVEMMKEIVEVEQSEFTEPDDDWGMTGFLQTKDYLSVVPLSQIEDRDIRNAIFCTLAKNMKAVKAALITSAWYLHTDSLDDVPESLEDHPGREEVVQLLVFNQERVEMWHAPIIRHEDHPPTLDTWIRWSEEKGATFEGRFVDDLREVLR